jgi:hypothetical protein
MSYSRSYSETVSTTVSVDYPSSEHGGSTSVSVDIPVEVNIYVDTDPFDRSVDHCGNNVNLLTAAVVATESAEVASKELNSRKVATTIIGGFFSLIRSDISQQVAELSQSVDAYLMHLKELAQSCLAKKKQMEGDYTRIMGRYMKIFGDLNNELSNRIYELDKPAFAFKNETDHQKIRTSDNDMVNTVAIFGVESSDLQSKISSSIAKKRALDTLNKAKLFLWQQKNLNATIQQSMLNESVTNTMYSPICYLEVNNDSKQVDKTVFSSDYLGLIKDRNKKNELVEDFSSGSYKWQKLSQDDQKKIRLYLDNEIHSKMSKNDSHSVRVREMIQKIANLDAILGING